MDNPVAWFEIYVQDMPRAKAFYEAVFGVELTALDVAVPEIEMWTFPAEQNAYGASGALVKLAGVPSGGNSTLVYFQCEDCAEQERRVLASGGSVERSKFSIGEHGFIALVFDTEGNLFGLHSMQ